MTPSQSLKVLKAEKATFVVQSAFLQKKCYNVMISSNSYLTSMVYQWQHVTDEIYFKKMLITFERKVPHTSHASQNDQKSSGYLSKTSATTCVYTKGR